MGRRKIVSYVYEVEQEVFFFLFTFLNNRYVIGIVTFTQFRFKFLKFLNAGWTKFCTYVIVSPIKQSSENTHF